MLKTLTQFGILAAIVAMLAAVGTRPAPGAKGGGKGGDGGGGSASENNFDVALADHVPGDPACTGGCDTWFTTNTLYAPVCLGDTPGSSHNFSVRMPDGGDAPPTNCAVVTLNDAGGSPQTTGAVQLTDDIGFHIPSRKGTISSVEYFHAQDVIGEDGVWHQSLAMPLAATASADDDGFVLHVHQSSVEVWRHDKHQGGKPVELVGYIAIGDLVYTPQAQ